MSDIDTGAPVAAEGGEPGIRILAQFIRDLSMENPRAPDALRPSPDQPQIDLGVEMNARGREDGLFEVDLKLSARATREEQPVFHVEVMYGGLFHIAGVPEDQLEPVLLIEREQEARAFDQQHRRRLPALPGRPDRLRGRLRRAQGPVRGRGGRQRLITA